MTRRDRAVTILRSTGLAVIFGFGFAVTTSATGFYINQQGVRSLGRVDAGNTVAADDLETIFFNPAGLLKVWGHAPPDDIRMALGLHLIVPRNDQRNRFSTVSSPGTLGAAVPVGGGDAHDPTDPTPVPNLYVAAPFLNGRAAIGLGITAPFGLDARFGREWHGRYDATTASLRTVNTSVVVAYQVAPRLSVGGGLDVQYARAILGSAIPNPLTPGGPTAATDAHIDTEGNAYTAGFNAGLLYDIDGGTRLGLHYRSGMHHDLSGSSETSNLPPLLDVLNGVVGTEANLDLPAILGVGVSRTVGDDLTLLGEFTWFDWSTFRQVRIRFDDGRPDAIRPSEYRDAYGIAVGAEYPVSDRWTTRGGIHFDTTPTVDRFRDTTVPDSERLWLGLGASLRASDRLRFDVAVNHVFFRDTAIDLTRTFFDGTPLATAVNVNSRVTTTINTIAVEFRYAF